MVSSKLVAFSIVALSGITVVTILRKGLKNKPGFRRVKGDNYAETIKEGEDFISRMPDHILLEILFHLSTRDSVRTSLLSKRWRNLYLYLPRVEFSCHETFSSNQSDHFLKHESSDLMKRIFKIFGYKNNCTRHLRGNFINAVDTYLRLHSAFGIFFCSLTCCFLNSSSLKRKLQQWLSFLGSSRIRILHLNLTTNNHKTCSLNCEFISRVPSLVMLHLTGCFLEPTSKFIGPNYLKDLYLYKVTLIPSTIDCVFSNCLHLRLLSMENCNMPTPTLRICGSNLPLQFLLINNCSNFERIEIRADNLHIVEYFGSKLIEFSFEHIPKLRRMLLNLSHGNDENSTPFSCAELAKALPSLEVCNLYIYGQYHEMLTPAGFNMFRNMRDLFLGFSMFKPDQLSVASVLQMCPLLCQFNLQIEESASALKGQKVMGNIKFHNHLKGVMFLGFSGTESEMNVVEYFMRSAMVLEKMIISYCFSRYLGKDRWEWHGEFPLKEETRKEIEMLREHAISKNVELIIQPLYKRLKKVEEFSLTSSWSMLKYSVR